jgi:hypothetical protein
MDYLPPSNPAREMWPGGPPPELVMQMDLERLQGERAEELRYKQERRDAHEKHNRRFLLLLGP